jgi:hypothetical protein
MTKRAGTRAGQKPAVLGGAYALRPRPTRRLAGGGCSFSSWRRNTGSTGPRTARRRCDFWYSSMSAGAAAYSGLALTSRQRTLNLDNGPETATHLMRCTFLHARWSH